MWLCVTLDANIRNNNWLNAITFDGCLVYLHKRGTDSWWQELKHLTPATDIWKSDSVSLLCRKTINLVSASCSRCQTRNIAPPVLMLLSISGKGSMEIYYSYCTIYCAVSKWLGIYWMATTCSPWTFISSISSTSLRISQKQVDDAVSVWKEHGKWAEDSDLSCLSMNGNVSLHHTEKCLNQCLSSWSTFSITPDTHTHTFSTK